MPLGDQQHTGHPDEQRSRPLLNGLHLARLRRIPERRLGGAPVAYSEVARGKDDGMADRLGSEYESMAASYADQRG
jgi:hypothetical protein